MILWHHYILGLLFVLAGVDQIRRPQIYLSFFPQNKGLAKTMLLLIAFTEMILGFMFLNKNSQTIAAWGIFIYLLLLLPFHRYAIKQRKSYNFAPWMLGISTFIHIALLVWIMVYLI